MRALCTEVAGVVATAADEDEEAAGAEPATAPSRFAAAVKASREAAAQAGLAVPATCAPRLGGLEAACLGKEWWRERPGRPPCPCQPHARRAIHVELLCRTQA